MVSRVPLSPFLAAFRVDRELVRSAGHTIPLNCASYFIVDVQPILRGRKLSNLDQSFHVN